MKKLNVTRWITDEWIPNLEVAKTGEVAVRRARDEGVCLKGVNENSSRRGSFPLRSLEAQAASPGRHNHGMSFSV